jgi:16S rRNA (cytosine1402-N4)-methyltransferase
MAFEHKSVLLNEVIENLNIKPDGIYVDGTIGGGGHSYEIVRRLTTGRLIGIDQDEAAITASRERLNEFQDKVSIVRSNYCEMKDVLSSLGIKHADGILLDLGVSSYQLDTPERGFSYKEDEPLDMRMDTRNTKTAKDIVNDYSEMELYRIIRDYGEDNFAKNIAKHSLPPGFSNSIISCSVFCKTSSSWFNSILIAWKVLFAGWPVPTRSFIGIAAFTASASS